MTPSGGSSTVTDYLSDGDHETETGLYYYRARYYDAQLGRFLQVDPIGYKDQMNLYAYTGNDPVNYNDPTGKIRGLLRFIPKSTPKPRPPKTEPKPKAEPKPEPKSQQGNQGGQQTQNPNGQNTPSRPTTREELEADLTAKGYHKTGTSEGGYTTYKGPDGKTVTVKPDGEVVATQKVWNSDGTAKYPQRQDYEGNPLPNSPSEPGATRHPSTGHYVESIE